MFKKTVFIIATVGIIVFCFYTYIYKNHRDIKSEKSDFEITVQQMHTEFIEDESLATARYLDKTIEVSGVVVAIDTMQSTITMDDEKLIGLLSKTTLFSAKLGDKIIIKGRFLGYDNLFEQLKLDQVTIK